MPELDKNINDQLASVKQKRTRTGKIAPPNNVPIEQINISEDITVVERDSWEFKRIADLRKLARSRGVKHWKHRTRSGLIVALREKNRIAEATKKATKKEKNP
jgi:hypothetical protein